MDDSYFSISNSRIKAEGCRVSRESKATICQSAYVDGQLVRGPLRVVTDEQSGQLKLVKEGGE